ncbi:MAG: type IV toxin-antitoxin system AbiEi family antitoxin domain-containing protein [Oligoflexus sp.]|nr:type IV toxin-antitoxin system AbiEi family antitoxin domain-containing protein [Oligoflexus sp.]
MTHYKALQKIQKSAFTLKDANKLGVSSRMLTYLVKKEKLVRISQGVYSLPENLSIDTVDLIYEALLSVPKGIIGYQTAIHLYDLSDDPAGLIHIVVPYDKTPKVKLEDVKFHRTRTPMRSIQTQTLKGLKVTSLEQTLVDLLKSKAPLGVLLEIIARARKKGMLIQIDKLQTIADRQRAKAKIRPLLDALIT